MKFFLTLFIVTLTMSCSAKSLDVVEDSKLDCTNITTSAQVDDCVHEEMLTSVSLLEKSLNDFEERTKIAYEADAELGTEVIEIFHKSQKSWINFRDYNCKIEVFEITEGTPAYITAKNECITHMNNKRIKEVKSLLN